MDKLERYLDQVCRGIAGPRSLRQHIRQELRGHLLDAAAEYEAQGMTAPEALDRALGDFGGPEDVRAELEATHGHRLMGVVIDKAMQWKENTMKATWLWASWAHLALAGVILLELLFVTFANVFLVPRFLRVARDAGYNPGTEIGGGWVLGTLSALRTVGDHATPLLLLVIAAYGLFEWRLRGDNKPLIRLSALGTTALGMMVVVAMTSLAMLIPLFLMQPRLFAQIPERVPSQRAIAIDDAVARLGQAMDKGDWETASEQTDKAVAAVRALEADVSRKETRARLREANEFLTDMLRHIKTRDLERARAALAKFRVAYAPIGNPVRPEE